MKAPKPTTNRILPPAGSHVARVVQIIYLGTQKLTWQGQEKEAFRVRITWELPNEKASFKEGEPEKPFVVSKELSLSMGRKSSLRPFVEGILGCSLEDDEAYAFDLDEILGKECQVNLTHKDGEDGKYYIINSASSLLKGVSCPPAFNKVRVLSFDKWDQEFFDSLPDFLKEKITASKEYVKMKGGAPANYPTDQINPSDIPF